MTDTIQTLLVRDLESFIAEIELFPDDETPWQVLPGVTNSAATLALHVSGNLQHFVGGVLGGTGYARNRAAEFGTRVGTRAEIVDQLRATIDVVSRVLPTIDGERLGQSFPEALQGMTFRTDRFLLHLVAHLAHHLGQAGYLRRIVTGDDRSSQPMSLRPIADGAGAA
jgi:uncharacterized damage-inducible protein DinB